MTKSRTGAIIKEQQEWARGERKERKKNKWRIPNFVLFVCFYKKDKSFQYARGKYIHVNEALSPWFRQSELLKRETRRFFFYFSISYPLLWRVVAALDSSLHRRWPPMSWPLNMAPTATESDVFLQETLVGSHSWDSFLYIKQEKIDIGNSFFSLCRFFLLHIFKKKTQQSIASYQKSPPSLPFLPSQWVNERRARYFLQRFLKKERERGRWGRTISSI